MAGADWRSNLRDSINVAATESSKHRGASAHAHISRVGFTVKAHWYLIKAARKRHISISGYIRRATLAMVALDLEMKATDLFELDGGIMPIERNGPPSKDLDGKLYGRWEIQRDTAA